MQNNSAKVMLGIYRLFMYIKKAAEAAHDVFMLPNSDGSTLWPVE